MINPSNPSQLETFHLNKSEVIALLSAIKERSTSWKQGSIEKRKHHRFSPFNYDATITYEHPGGSTDNCRALLMDISTQGVGVAIRGYLHNGTLVSAHLKTNDGEMCIISGTVCWCEYFQRQVHLVGLSLHEPVDPRNFTTDAEWISLSIDNEDTSWMTDRTAIVIEGSNIGFSAVKMLLRNANIHAIHADSLGAGLDAIKEKPFDIIVLSDTIDENVSPNQAVENLRNHGYAGPIIVHCSSTNRNDDPPKGTEGYTILPNPLELAPFLAELRDIFSNSATPASGTTPIYSTLSTKHCSEVLFAEYLRLIDHTATRLEICIKNDDASAAIKLCKSLYSTGSSYGFPILSTSAHEAVKSLNASCSPKESATLIRNMIHLIKRLRSPIADDSTKTLGIGPSPTQAPDQKHSA